MSGCEFSFTCAAQNMVVSLVDEAKTPDAVESMCAEVKDILASREHTLIEGYHNVYFAADENFRIVFEKLDNKLVIKSVCTSA
jgi:hypothetical protein